ncbi:MAG TPA: aspartate aminotransferase family protein [Candidatus Limnocylindrales bacterium]|nr:aspartate aminotransferase family protein [Candidatus Limnocylindrales bacterium]
MSQTIVSGDAVPSAGAPGAHLSPVLGRYHQQRWSHGEGHRLFDSDGGAYLDFACGIATTVLGHRHPAVTAAIHAQVDRLLHASNGLGYFEPVDRLAAELSAALPAPLDTVLFQNSGTEAIEAAVKLARRVTGRPGIVGFSGGFHGRTMAAVALTSSSPNYRRGYEPLLPAVHLAPFPNVYRDFAGDERRATQESLAAFDRLLATELAPTDVAAVVVEPVQGEGGFNPAPLDFLRGLRERCDSHGILLVADEVQCGYGRTGTMWAFERAGIVPDVVCLAKAIANGLPLGAIVARRELHERWGLGAHGTTFGGNPVACAAGVAVLETIASEGLVENAAARGEELRRALGPLAERDAGIGDLRGPGLMVAVEFVRDRGTREPDGERADRVIARCAELGLLLLTCGTGHQVVRWIPPLDVSSAEIAEGVAIFEQAVAAG